MARRDIAGDHGVGLDQRRLDARFIDRADAGNIGPVADALMARLKSDLAIVCPAFPTNKRTVYKGYLFVGDELLSESGMRHHPLTPMTDPSLVRVLQRQTRHKVGLVQYATVVKGAQAVREAFVRLYEEGLIYRAQRLINWCPTCRLAHSSRVASIRAR